MANPILNHPRFHDEEAAYQWVEALVWPNGRVCPHCGVIENSGKLKGKTTRVGLYKCYACRKPFTVKIGTIFEDSHVKLHVWMQAMYLLASSKKGMSTNQLRRTLGVHMKTAWHMSHRIREAMRDDNSGPLGGEGKIVEVDETLQGPAGTYIHPRQGLRKKSGIGDKRIVLSLVERHGRAKSVKINTMDMEEIRSIMLANIDPSSSLMTDEARRYTEIGKAFASHDTVNHSAKEYARGIVSSNTVEGFFSVFKRGMHGTYQHCGEQHLQRYLHEFDFRYSNRIALGVDDEERTNRAIRGIVGKRLTYRETVDAQKTKIT